MGSNVGTTSRGATAATSGTEPPDRCGLGDSNMAVIVGRLVSEPETRTLPSGSVAASFSLTVRTTGAKTTSVPAVWYDPPKRMLRWPPGEQVIAHGSIVRRFFRTGAGLGSATEVVVKHAELTHNRAKTDRVAGRARTALDALVAGP